MLKGKKIVIGITGSIAAYKIPFLVRLLVKEEAEVRVIMTPSAKDFVTPLTLATLSRNDVIFHPFDQQTGAWNSHVELGTWADLMLFAPVTACTLGKMASGVADNFLVTAYLSAKCPVMIAPAMDLDMYNHPSTRKNVEILKSYGNQIIEPQTGELASGLSGPGRLEEPERILEIIRNFFFRSEELAGKKILITAGPTYEEIDPVRFIGNRSSGKMGFALAEEGAARGAEVTLISGPVHLNTHHPAVRRINVISAADMYEAVMKFAPEADIIMMAAAVADYSPREKAPSKIKKHREELTIHVVPTVDILSELGKNRKQGQILVGFALETNNEEENAKKKLKEKNVDMVVLNSLQDTGAGFDHPTNKVTIFLRNGEQVSGDLKRKDQVACDIFDTLALLSKPSQP
ncbi:MAG TPA: bifunctional phosphopantothenoylcysteine decarboxylase/phosphopantothenate--cysteine ligase CoaBC [Bacteroidales bacterium]|nr:bifunctional phosphopantothenoylcysteine decarboxylase/phosphopantothenate--cysteine ligase CoaBC [Bacteroidales bacterium]HPS73590.1 bifunctional phosphopantothenoylcysteine decarboxylase/phosphopantothenate--cysteine ligase CoaBC [Bacteroidales bacterium]